MTLLLELNQSTSIPLELEGLNPNAVREMPLEKIKNFEIFHGNQRTTLAEFFNVSGDAHDEHFRFVGDLSGVHWIGTKMCSGRIDIEGKAGRHLGSEMQGGEISVQGDVGDWLGAEMIGGAIHVHGDASHLVGAAYRGSQRGMLGGSIVVDGAAGNEIGHSMRRGMIAIGGSAGDLVGFNMLAGTILVAGAAGIRHGAGMRRGTLVFLAEQRPDLLPTFTYVIVATVILIGVIMNIVGLFLIKETMGHCLIGTGSAVIGLGAIGGITICRTYATKLQDRVVRTEMRIRLKEVLPSDQQAVIPNLTRKQCIALRFASDEELPELVRKVISENITDLKAIKLLVQDWQADWFRV